MFALRPMRPSIVALIDQSTMRPEPGSASERIADELSRHLLPDHVELVDLDFIVVGNALFALAHRQPLQHLSLILFVKHARCTRPFRDQTHQDRRTVFFRCCN